jgi:hypothetical protein
LPFYDLRRTALSCPNCGNAFSATDLHVHLKKSKEAVVDQDGTDDEKIVEISQLGFDSCSSDVDLIDETGAVDELSGIKKIEDDS